MEASNIAWTKSTFNPWIGCTEISPGCDNCYAKQLDLRHRYGGATHWGSGVPRFRTSESYWRQPARWNREQGQGAGAPWLVFCASLADVYDNEVPPEWRADLFELIQRTPNLTWLLLTKRVGNVEKLTPFFLPANVWLGVSVVDQKEADRDIPKLLAIPASKRFVSYEPALGPVDFGQWLGKQVCCGNAVQIGGGPDEPPEFECCRVGIPGIDWVIVGGESRQGKALARPFSLDWARAVRDQCKTAGAAFFMKQTGSDTTALYERVQKDRAGANPDEWPEDLRVREFPQ